MVRGGIFLGAAWFATALVATAGPTWAQTTRIGSAEKMTFGDAAALVARSCGADIDANCRGVKTHRRARWCRQCLCARNRQAVQRFDQGNLQVNRLPDHDPRRQP